MCNSCQLKYIKKQNKYINETVQNCIGTSIYLGGVSEHIIVYFICLKWAVRSEKMEKESSDKLPMIPMGQQYTTFISHEEY